MAIAVSQTVTASITTGDVITMPSWTPVADDLILVAIATRETNTSTIFATVTGNGLTFVHITNVKNDDSEFLIKIFRAQGSSPTGGALTITFDGPNTKPAVAVATRFSGCVNSGTNGSDAVEVIVTDDGPAGSNNDMKKNITTISTNALVWAFGSHRDKTFTVPGGQTAISINNSIGSGTEVTSASTWQQTTTTPGTVTMGADNDLSLDTDWAIITVSIKPAVEGASTSTPGGYKIFLEDRQRRLIFRNASGEYLMSAMGYVHPLDSNYSGNEVEGIDIRNTVRCLTNWDPRKRLNQGDYLWLNPVQKYLITSIKPFGHKTEIIGVSETSIRAAVPDIIKVIDLSAGTAETVIWQPVNGKKFRLMELQLRIGSTTVACKLTFRDGNGGKIILVGFPANNSDVYAPKLGNGILSELANNSLTVTRSVSDTLTGYLLGFEE